MISALYGRSMVIANEAQKDQGKVKYLGNNAGRVLVLVSNADHAFLRENELVFLTKMLTACQLNIGDVAIVNVQNTSAKDAVSELSAEKIIDFGTHPEISFESGKIVASVPLRQMLGESPEARQLKGKLWSGLKQMFGL
jgi:UDP-N-acetylmuramyl pentapeptide synthase